MDTTKLKKKYGWSEELEDFFINSNTLLKTQYRGSFRLKKHNDSYFWYYRLGSDISNRDKYLCSVEPKEKSNNQTSFQYCCEVLLSKLQSHFTISIKDKRFLFPYVQQFIDLLEKEGQSSIGRNSKTTSGMIGGLRNFKIWSESNQIKLHIVPTNEMKLEFRNYITYLHDKGITRSSIKGYVQDIRYCLEWLVRDKLMGGLELFPSQPLTIELQNSLLEQICGKPPRPVEKEFRKEYYENCYRDCLTKVRSIWEGYCKNDGVLERIKDKNGKVNQPPHFLGRDIVYFVSLLQLRGGFRVGEVLYSYRNMSIYNEHHLKFYPKDMGSFWDKTEDGWILKIRNSKGKDRDVPINDTIWSWVKPPSWIKCKEVKNGKSVHYETPLIEVIFELFPNSYYSFPSPNHNEKPNGKRSITYYMNSFKDELVTKCGWDKYGVDSSHNLRSFFISYTIRSEDITPFQICEITGHTLKVMEKYYLRENLQSKLETFKKVPQRSLIVKNKDVQK